MGSCYPIHPPQTKRPLQPQRRAGSTYLNSYLLVLLLIQLMPPEAGAPPGYTRIVYCHSGQKSKHCTVTPYDRIPPLPPLCDEALGTFRITTLVTNYALTRPISPARQEYPGTVRKLPATVSVASHARRPAPPSHPISPTRPERPGTVGHVSICQ
jgi:hypothetical protein